LCTLQCPHAHRPDTAIFLSTSTTCTQLSPYSRPFKRSFYLFPPVCSSLSPYTTFISFSRAAYACHSILITLRSTRDLEVCVVGVRPTNWCCREAGQPTTHTSGVPALERAELSRVLPASVIGWARSIIHYAQHVLEVCVVGVRPTSWWRPRSRPTASATAFFLELPLRFADNFFSQGVWDLRPAHILP